MPSDPLDDARVTLAKNLVLARKACDITQAQLAKESGISRATIAQLESGGTDPRLSTLVDLARALEVSPIVLLVGENDLRALMTIAEEDHSNLMPEDQVEEMRRLISSGLGKQRIQAAAMGAAAASVAGLSIAGAAIGSVLMPGIGTALGGVLGGILAKKREDKG